VQRININAAGKADRYSIIVYMGYSSIKFKRMFGGDSE
jgi:hypothetical protein